MTSDVGSRARSRPVSALTASRSSWQAAREGWVKGNQVPFRQLRASRTARLRALNAAEAHRWETGHVRVIVRDAQGCSILREVLGNLAAA